MTGVGHREPLDCGCVSITHDDGSTTSEKCDMHRLTRLPGPLPVEARPGATTGLHARAAKAESEHAAALLEIEELRADLAAIRRALGVSDDMTVEAIVCAVLLMRQENREREALLSSVTMLERERDLARRQRDQAIHDSKREHDNYTRLAHESAAADWTCPECGDKSEGPGECRDCFVDERKSVQRVPGAVARVLALEAAEERLKLELANKDDAAWAALHEKLAASEALKHAAVERAESLRVALEKSEAGAAALRTAIEEMTNQCESVHEDGACTSPCTICEAGHAALASDAGAALLRDMATLRRELSDATNRAAIAEADAAKLKAQVEQLMREHGTGVIISGTVTKCLNCADNIEHVKRFTAERDTVVGYLKGALAALQPYADGTVDGGKLAGVAIESILKMIALDAFTLDHGGDA